MTLLHNEKTVCYHANYALKCLPKYTLEGGLQMVRNTNRKEKLGNLWVNAVEYEDVLSELLATKAAYNNLFDKLSTGVSKEIRQLKHERLCSFNQPEEN